MKNPDTAFIKKWLDQVLNCICDNLKVYARYRDDPSDLNREVAERVIEKYHSYTEGMEHILLDLVSLYDTGNIKDIAIVIYGPSSDEYYVISKYSSKFGRDVTIVDYNKIYEELYSDKRIRKFIMNG